MIKEYYKFIKDYLVLAELKFKYVFVNFLSAILYKGASIMLPIAASLIIKYLTISDARMTSIALAIFAGIYVFYTLTLYVNYYIYGFNMNYCYNRMTKKVLNKLLSVDDNFTRIIRKES